jgi:hypothetical protein
VPPTAPSTSHTSGGLWLPHRHWATSSHPLATPPGRFSPDVAANRARPMPCPRPRVRTRVRGLPTTAAADHHSSRCRRSPTWRGHPPGRPAPAWAGPGLAAWQTGVPAASPPGCSAYAPASTPGAETMRDQARPGHRHWRRRATPRSGSAQRAPPSHSIAEPQPPHGVLC